MSSPFKYLFFLLSILTLIALSLTRKHDEDGANNSALEIYESWLVNHNKKYNVIGEKERRFEVFKDNLRFIDEHNNDESNTYKLGLNKFADLTNYEFRSLYLLSKAHRGQYDILEKAVPKQTMRVATEDVGREFQFYKSGVFTGYDCGTTLDHSVVVIGHDTTDDGKDYWIVKNSWGTDWGENGNIRIEKNTASKANNCGIATEGTYLRLQSHTSNPTHETTVACDSYNSCPSRTTCCCVYTYGPYCFTWGCCPMESAVCCDDGSRCCPHDYPVCNTQKRNCSKRKNSLLSIKALERTPAKFQVKFS